MYNARSFLLRNLHKIIEPKDVVAGFASHNIFGFYMEHFFLGSPLETQIYEVVPIWSATAILIMKPIFIMRIAGSATL
jgi:hypothetical protein